MCRCLIVGCTYKEKTLDQPPPNYPEIPKQIKCINCGVTGDGVYRREDYYFTFFFIPCCRINKGAPYLSCRTCHGRFGNYGTNVCRYCRTASPTNFSFCPNCGKRQSVYDE